MRDLAVWAELTNRGCRVKGKKGKNLSVPKKVRIAVQGRV